MAYENSDKLIIFLVLILSVLNIYLQFFKWKIVCNSFLNINNDKKIWLSLFYGFSGGIVTPVRVGEYFGRKLPFQNTSLLKTTIATIAEKFVSLLIVLFVGSSVAIFFVSKYYSWIYSIPFFLFIVALILIIHFFIKGYLLTNRFVMNLAFRFHFVENIVKEFKYLRELSKETVKKLFFYSTLFYVVIVLQYSFLALAFAPNGNMIHFLISGTLVMFTKSVLPFISFADLGIRESTSVLVLNEIGYSKAVGFNSAIFLFLFNLLIPSLIGLTLLIRRDK